MHSVAATSTNREGGVGTIIDGTKKMYNKNGENKYKKKTEILLRTHIIYV